MGALWSIWKVRNDQVFRNHRPTIPVINVQLQESDKQHHTFVAHTNDPSWNPRDPTTPHGFSSIQLGQQPTAVRTLTIQIDGSWDRLTNAGGVAWAKFFDPTFGQVQKGLFCFALLALVTEATACLRSLTWARNVGLLNITILTDSSCLVQLLQADHTRDITLKWTIQRIRSLVTISHLVNCKKSLGLRLCRPSPCAMV